MFPRLDVADLQRIAGDGKIPDHSHWQDRIADGELAIDADDEITAAMLVTHDGEVVHPGVLEALGSTAAPGHG